MSSKKSRKRQRRRERLRQEKQANLRRLGQPPQPQPGLLGGSSRISLQRQVQPQQSELPIKHDTPHQHQHPKHVEDSSSSQSVSIHPKEPDSRTNTNSTPGSVPFGHDELQAPVVSSQHPKKDEHTEERKNVVTQATPTSLSHQQTPRDLSLLSSSSSRKRPLDVIDFVFPTNKNGTIQPYAFGSGGGSASTATTSNSSYSKNGLNTHQLSFRDEKKDESLDEILQGTRKKAKNVNSLVDHRTKDDGPIRPEPSMRCSSNLPDPETSTCASSSSIGQLSGLSVEQALQDRWGCRPRANSTDGELNLPQRGLCDERTVLQSYQWNMTPTSTPRGFINLGNTCFLNSTLQCLLYLPPFSQTLLSLSSDDNSHQRLVNTNHNHVKPPNNPGKRITRILRTLFQQVLLGQRGGGNNLSLSFIRQPMAPHAIVKALPSLGSCGSRKGYKFRPGRQEDAHEFLVHLLDAMHDGELKQAGINQHVSGWRDRLPVPRLDETTFIHRIFGGYFRSQVMCTSCKHRSNTYDPFLDLSLEVSHKSCSSLFNAIHEFTKKETLDHMNRWKCSGCHKKVCATKQLTIFRPPLALCLQLKRFTFSGFAGFGSFGGVFGKMGNFGGFGSGGGKKITKPVDFPSVFRLPLSDGRSCEYSLTGLVIHVGGSASSGHYTAYVKQPIQHGKEQWFSVDDSFVEAVSERSVLQQRDAYMLFYSRREVKLEFPTPPLRSSMTAEEAREFSRSRARVRAESIDQRSEAEGSSSAESSSRISSEAVSSTSASRHASESNFSATRLVGSSSRIGPIPTLQAPILAMDPAAGNDGKRSSQSQGNESRNDHRTGAESSRPTQGEGTGESKNREVATKSSSSSSSSSGSSSSNSSSSSTTSSSTSEDECDDDNEDGVADDDVTSFDKNPATKLSSKSSALGGGGDDHLKSRDQKPASKPSSKPTASNAASKSETLDKLSSSFNDSGTEESDNDGKPPPLLKAAKLPSSHPEAATLKSPPADASSSAAKVDRTPQAKTRIVVDRGNARGKVEVMVGPRYKSKAWKPPTSEAAKGGGFGLLGDRPVGQWEDDSGDRNKAQVKSGSKSSSSQSASDQLRGELERSEDKKEKSRKKRMFLDRWDGHLDQGKLSKIRSDTTSQYDLFSNTDATVWEHIRQLTKVKDKGGLAISYLSESTRDRFQKLQEQNVKQGFGAISYISTEQEHQNNPSSKGDAKKKARKRSKNDSKDDSGDHRDPKRKKG